MDLLVSLIVKVEMHFPNNNLVFFLPCDCRILNPHPQCTQKPFRERMCIRRNASQPIVKIYHDTFIKRTDTRPSLMSAFNGSFYSNFTVNMVRNL